MDLSLVSVRFVTARAHHDTAGRHPSEGVLVLTALSQAATG
ncbi:hypothetical protein ACFRI7_17145 [Streptomyces sp. NPDC056716]